MRRTVLMVLGALLFCGLTASASSLLVNGSFESPVITTGFYQTVVGPDSTTIPGWTVGLTSVDLVQGAIWAHAGIQGVDMAGTPGPGSLTQTVATIPGQLYQLSFWVSSNGGPFADSLTVKWDGGTLATLSTPAQTHWNGYEFNVTGTGSDTVSFATPITTDFGPLLDDVSLVSIPEPATLTLIGSGLLLIGLRIRRRA
jgi:hypothetical protein